MAALDTAVGYMQGVATLAVIKSQKTIEAMIERAMQSFV